MPKAEINLPDGTKISIDGSIDDIIKIQEAFSGRLNTKKQKTDRDNNRKIPKRKVNKVGPLGRIRGIIEQDFFKEKRNIDEVRRILEEKAIFYKTSDIAPSLVRLVKKGELRRLKEDGQWRYVNP